MTADFASNINMMMGLNSFTNGAYKYQYPTINGQSFMDSSIFAMNMPAAFQQGVAVANALNATNYMPAGSDYLNTTLSTPVWLQNVGNNFTSAYTNPFVSAQTNHSNPSNSFTSGNSAPVVSPYVDQLAGQNGYEKTAKAGIYMKDDKYYKFDMMKNNFVEASKAEIDATKRAEAKKAEQDVKDKKKADAAAKRQVSTICADVYDAIKDTFWSHGTDEDKLEAAVKRITKDNVLAAFEMWESAGYESKFGNEGGLIASIQDDVSGDFQDDLENHIAEALCQKAEELDLDDEAADFMSKITSARTSRGGDKDKAVNQAFKEIVRLIKAKEAENK